MNRRDFHLQLSGLLASSLPLASFSHAKNLGSTGPWAELEQASGGKLTTQPGTRLVREWQGRHYQVTVLASGFDYDGRIYSSLTAIAREITGISWSGPRFFGLKS